MSPVSTPMTKRALAMSAAIRSRGCRSGARAFDSAAATRLLRACSVSVPHGSRSEPPRAASARPSAIHDASGHSFSGRGMKQDAVGLPARLRDSLAREPEIDSATGSVTEREAGQHAIARDGMEVTCDAMPYVVEPRRRSLTDAVRVVAMPAAAGEPRHERGAHEPLCVDDIVVAARAYGAPEAGDLAPGRGR